MMLAPLPFSGLSLLVHLAIIALSALAGWLGLTHMKRTKKQHGEINAYSVVLKVIVSVLIIGFVGGITLLFIWIAIATGIQSGSDEPQRVFVESLFF